MEFSNLDAALSHIEGLRLDEARVRTHALRPSHVREVISSHGLHDGIAFPEFVSPIVSRFPVYFDIDGFGKDLHNALRTNVTGYVMQLRHRGRVVYTLQWDRAKRPWDGALNWTPTVPMHVASCSKLVTAIAMTRLLDARDISWDAPIAPFLPAYWALGPNVNQVTFRHLMTHQSGLGIANRSDSDYVFMRTCVATGSSGVGSYLYQNMNFGLCRILMATINGNIDPATTFFIPLIPNSNDLLWDIVTTQAYAQYVHDNVFGPSGVIEATLDHPNHHALAYSFPPQAAGWNSGDLTSMSGGAGWHLSVEDLLKVMTTFRRGHLHTSAERAKEILDAGLGVDLIQETPLGTLYNKNGLWGNPGGQVEQSLAYFLPRDMELVVFANSPIGSPAQFFRDVVTTVYVDNIRPRIMIEGITLNDATSYSDMASAE